MDKTHSETSDQTSSSENSQETHPKKKDTKFADQGYLIGIEDMEPDCKEMILKGYTGSLEFKERIEIMTCNFKDLKRELLLLIQNRMDHIRHETKGAFQ